MQDISKIILSKYDTLSDSHQQIAKVIFRNLKNIPNYKIKELAVEASVSISSISKFCKFLGLEGFDELRYMIKYSNPTANIDNQLLLTLSCTHENIIAQIEDAVNLILYNKVYIFAKSNSANIAFDFYYKLNKIKSDVVFERDSHLIRQAASEITDGVVVLVSNSANTEICTLAQDLKCNSKAKIISVTNNNRSKLNKYSDIVLNCVAFEIDPTIKQYLPFNSKYSLMYALDLIFCTYFQLNYNRNLEKIRECRLKGNAFF